MLQSVSSGLTLSCFGHNLHLEITKAIKADRWSLALCRKSQCIFNELETEEGFCIAKSSATRAHSCGRQSYQIGLNGEDGSLHFEEGECHPHSPPQCWQEGKSGPVSPLWSNWHTLKWRVCHCVCLSFDVAAHWGKLLKDEAGNMLLTKDISEVK